MKNINTIDLEQTALSLKSLLILLSTADTDNAIALQEFPTAIGAAAELAEQLYCAIVDKGVKL